MRKAIKFTLLALPLVSISQSFAQGSECGELPAEPALFSKTGLTTQEGFTLNEQMEVFMQETQTFKRCIDTAIIELDPEAPDYDSTFSGWLTTKEQLLEYRNLTIERVNYLLANPVPEADPEEPE